MEQVTGDYKSFRYEMSFTPVDEGRTRMEMRVQAELPWGPLGKLAGWLATNAVRRDLEGVLHRFKSRVEGQAGRAPAEAPEEPAS